MNTTAAEALAEVAAAKPDSTQLALDRTRLAFERTTMAWVRTATSLITFGFSVYKFFQIGGKEQPGRLIGPREFALMMISIGVIALVLATFQHWHSMRSLKAHAPNLDAPPSIALLVGALVSILGIIALVAVIFRH